MKMLKVSEKGQVTLPASIRRKVGITSKSCVEIEVDGENILIRPVRSISEVGGVFQYVAKPESADWESVRSSVEADIARQAAGE